MAGSMEYVRKTYRVPARRGGRVVYTGYGRPVLGTIRSSRNGHLNIQPDDEPRARKFHPTWELEYLPWTEREVDA